ncbi:site-2 protease family protein [Actinomadura sp. ATCC 31491]|uniref:Zinc metalloprotease n=1 Tax=Actinomadura luzonensis TaxID=2805427 RepID=A0ABT0G2X8_9ACTN|nr:site-2 protease family protein [Actinomadura luzonensis]MCK2218966.1 site-2 protease family protein [Actinomadura luzonensis]
MRQSLRLGRVAGVPVGAHWSALGVVLLVAGVLGGVVLPAVAPGSGPAADWAAGVATGLLLMASLLAHELAHALVARRRGLEVVSVTLWVLGGVTEFRGEPPTPRIELETAVAGPVTSLALGGLALAGGTLLPATGPAGPAVSWLAAMNLLIGAFNLLPGSPLDGGRVLHALLWRHYGDRGRADAATARAGYGLGAGLSLLAFAAMWAWNWLAGLWLLVTGWYIMTAARGEATGRAARQGLGGVLVRDVMTADPDLAPSWMSVQDLVTGVVLGSRQSVFPVVGFAGTPVGALSLETLLAVPPARRAATRVGTLTGGRPAPRVVSPDDAAVTLLESAGPAGTRGGPLPAVVVEGGRVVGMVTAADLGRMVQQALLKPLTAIP